MNIPVAPLNRLVVTLEKKLYDTVTFDSGITLHIDPSWHPEEFSMLKAKVVSVPKGLSARHDYKDLTCDIQPGDEILVRYDLVFHYNSQPDRDSPVYKNMFLMHDEENSKLIEYWMCDIQKVFAVIRNGKFIMQNGYVYMEPLRNKSMVSLFWPGLTEAPLTGSGLILPPFGNYESPNFCARVKYAKQYLPGSVLYFNKDKVQKYAFDSDIFWIVKESHVLAIETAVPQNPA